MNVTTVLVCISLLVHMATCQQTDYRLACYVTGHSHSHPALPPVILDQADPHLCTHIIHASMDIDQDLNIKAPSREDRSIWGSLRTLKERNPDLKILLAVGSWSSTNTRLVEMSSDQSGRQGFVDSAVQRLREEGCDGLDVAWLTGALGDTDLLTLLLKELRGAFQEEARSSSKDPLLLSTAVSGLEVRDPRAPDGHSFPQYVDFISLVTYDLLRSSEAMPDLERLAAYWSSQGVEAQKLNLGFPLYAPSLWSRENHTHHEVGETGQQRGEYAQVCHFVRMSHAHHGDPGPSSHHTHGLRGRVRQLRSLGLGGASLWSLDLDDPSGTLCDRGSFPITRQVRSSLRGRRGHGPHQHHPRHHRHHQHRHDDRNPGPRHCHRHRVRPHMESSGQHGSSV